MEKGIEIIKNRMQQLKDDGSDVAMERYRSLLKVMNVLENVQETTFDEVALKKEYNIETYGKMTDWDRKQLWNWVVEKLKGKYRSNDREMCACGKPHVKHICQNCGRIIQY